MIFLLVQIIHRIHKKHSRVPYSSSATVLLCLLLWETFCKSLDLSTFPIFSTWLHSVQFSKYCPRFWSVWAHPGSSSFLARLRSRAVHSCRESPFKVNSCLMLLIRLNTVLMHWYIKFAAEKWTTVQVAYKTIKSFYLVPFKTQAVIRSWVSVFCKVCP